MRGISRATMASQLKFIVGKLQVSTSTLAVLRAARLGLYVPRFLATAGGSRRAPTRSRTPLPSKREQPLTAHYPTPLKRAVLAIEAHPEYPYTTGKLAQIANVSVRTLQNAFRQHMDVTPSGYVRQTRPARAHQDLCERRAGDTTVTRIAHRWGFTNLSHFAAVYKARYGESPSASLRTVQIL
jgi:transcriptional regulator GlxA family with amidase domain